MNARMRGLVTAPEHDERVAAEGERVTTGVVVGVDGSKKALSAVRWGAVEAANRQLPLHLVHALDPTDAANALPSALSCSLDSARTSLREAREVALSTRSGLDVDCILAHGRPADVLAGTGHPSLICVGASSSKTPHPGHHASLTTELIVTADCPVTLFRRDPVESGWVVAEVGAEPHTDDIIRMAVAESVLRDLSLRLLLDTPRDTDQVGISRADLRSRVEIVLDRWRRVHAGLDCRVVPEIWSRDDFLTHHKTRIALFIAPPCHDHDIGTILHPAADAALDILDGPVMLYVEPGSTRRSAAAGGDVRPSWR
ncbi:hypothetical protein MMUR_35440 [Mycolicibacterium murale]|uniref:UspA domain-containing protein n=1 Tax=Mycolicibacterium murale TaxID=182220 RepID=A0A7I9WPV7_9MYCO|nr:universal stress protein [Mycolicibacterium murale]MCV7180384.1 universal stress protein [Mycolicibacterium murale]GFG59408.1 hypothetical protein MMUR_35440 [Mycolicibacterium murale]